MKELEAARKVYLIVVLGRHTVYHTEYIREKIEYAYSVDKLKQFEYALDDVGRKLFYKLFKAELEEMNRGVEYRKSDEGKPSGA